MAFTDEEYEQMAIKAIIKYKNKDYTDDEIKTLYPLAIPFIVANIKKSLDIDSNIKSETQGPRSKTYKDNLVVIDDVIKLLLGNPYIRLY
jgi:hypothetical protein